jgi:rRNA processing protein Gar1
LSDDVIGPLQHAYVLLSYGVRTQSHQLVAHC